MGRLRNDPRCRRGTCGQAADRRASGSLWVVAVSLICGSSLTWAADQMGRHRRGEEETTLRDAMFVGTSQILALLFPGFSRSGATMSTALILDMERVAATRLSFFLGIPALTGAGVYELKDAVGSGAAMAPLIVGTLVSFVVAYASIAWLLRFVVKHTFNAFVGYRIIVGVLPLILLGAGVINT